MVGPCVVGGEAEAFGAVFVVAPHLVGVQHRERGQEIGEVVAGEPVEVGVDRVQVGVELLVPSEGRIAFAVVGLEQDVDVGKGACPRRAGTAERASLRALRLGQDNAERIGPQQPPGETAGRCSPARRRLATGR